MKASLFTVCLLAMGLLAEAQTAKPKTATAAKSKPVATVQKKTTTVKSKTVVRKTTPKPAVATAPKATTTAVAPVVAVAEPAPVLAQQTVVETKPELEVTTKESSKRSKKVKAEKAPKPEKAARVEKVKEARPEKPARFKAESAYSGKGLSIGIRGGVSALLNEFTPDGVEGVESGASETTPGFTTGLVINYGLGNVFSIQPEILYARRSVKFTGEASGSTIAIQASANYVEVPLLLKLSFGRKTRFFVNAGPYAAYGLDGRAKLILDGEVIADEKQKLTSDDARLEYGVTGGLGVSIPVGPGSLLLEGRYNYSLGTNEDPKPAVYVNQQIATVSVSYLLRLGRK